MSKLTLFCRSATTFKANKELDESAFRKYLQRFVDEGLGVSLASGVTGECHALSRDELKRVYEIGAEIYKGKLPVYASLPGQPTALAAISYARLAINAGVDIVNVYGPAAHGYRPTDKELTAYFEDFLAAVDHPTAIAPNPVMGYTPSPALIAGICNRHSQVVTVNLSGLGEAYFVELKELMRPGVGIYVPVPSSWHTLGLGAAGLIDVHANILPKTHRRYIDLYEAKDYDGLNQVYAELRRYSRHISKWGSVRSIKMALKILKLPGGEGGARRPFLMPDDDEVAKFAQGLLELKIAEIDQLAQAAGIAG